MNRVKLEELLKISVSNSLIQMEGVNPNSYPNWHSIVVSRGYHKYHHCIHTMITDQNGSEFYGGAAVPVKSFTCSDSDLEWFCGWATGWLTYNLDKLGRYNSTEEMDAALRSFNQ